MKHFYLHTSNHDLLTDLRLNKYFQSVYDYSSTTEIQKSHQNEIGKIKIDLSHYHIILGALNSNGCPWCAHAVELKQIYRPNSFNRDIAGYDKYCMECPNCHSRGPIMNVCQQVIHHQDDMNEIKDMISQRYKFRRQWDADFKNPYDEQNAL